jgi:predicted NBD/HSP70 family sugar kinase
MTTLVIDIGGTNIKLRVEGQEEAFKCPSGPQLTPAMMIKMVQEATKEWQIDRVSIGYPGPVVDGNILLEPNNLGKGWLHFDFQEGLGRPVKLINDAAMQALGSYEGGRMLFLGLGTGLGTAMILNDILIPLELGQLPYKKGNSYEHYVGTAGLRRAGRQKWEKHVHDIVERMQNALLVEYVVLGGGNVKKLDRLPPGSRRGDNQNAFRGGLRLWDL